MKNKKIQYSDNWSTPKLFYERLDDFFKFKLDPCPLNWDLKKYGWDGLKINWKSSNYVNPPYSLNLKNKFVLKGIEENLKGNSSVFLLPVSTSTVLFHEHILPNCDNVIFLKGRLKFEGVSSNGEWINPFEGIDRSFDILELPKKIQSGQHDSMLIIFDKFNNYYKNPNQILNLENKISGLDLKEFIII